MWEYGKCLNTRLVFTIIGNMGKTDDSIYGTCKIDSKSRITLPPKVMNFLKTSPGDLISIERDENDCLCLHKAYIYVKRNNKCNSNRLTERENNRA